MLITNPEDKAANKVDYKVNYNDSRFKTVEADKKAALSEVDVTYGNMIGSSDKYYQNQINAVKDYEKKQTQIQNEQTDFAIEQIEQQKEQATKDYTKEQSGAYVDWQKQSNQYGVNAEQQAAQGMANTGYSESSQVAMYNQYQNRVATARESYNQAILNYNNAIKDARLQNNAALAEIAYNSLQKQLELSLAGFQYKNTLVQAQAAEKREVSSEYYGRYQDVLSQINTENALAEEVRQYNTSLAEEQRQYNETLALEKQQLALQEAQLAEEKRQFNVTQAAKAADTPVVKPATPEVDNTPIESEAAAYPEQEKSATEALNELISSGASKDTISNQISLALRKGEISKTEAANLRKTFTPRGLTY